MAASDYLNWPPAGTSSWPRTSASLEEMHMASELLRAPEAAQRLGLPTKELLRLIYGRKIRHVMAEGIAHVPEEAVEDFRGKGS